jgi:hypothetical protein
LAQWASFFFVQDNATTAWLVRFRAELVMRVVEVEAMPRFFFSPVTSRGAATDTLGEICQDLSEARERARQTAAELISEQLQSGQPPSGWVEVEDEQHRPLFMVPLRSVAS